MNLSFNELLQLLNLLIVPGAWYIVKLEGKITRLEVMIESLSKGLEGHMTREEKMFDRVLKEAAQ